MGNKYKTPRDYKFGLEAKLKNRAKESGRPIERERQIYIFDRFLKRLSLNFPGRYVVKGGFALELRLDNARSTKDIDISMTGSPGHLLEELRQAGSLTLDDFLTFEIRKPKNSKITNEGLKYEGVRFRVECKLAGKIYGSAFGIDIVFGKIFGEIETVRTTDYFQIAGTQTHILELYPIETHIAEKLHAYSVPPEKRNSRIKDLPDIAILAGIREIEGRTLRAACDAIFNKRKTHLLPSVLLPPPSNWGNRYSEMASLNRLEWEKIEDLFTVVEIFINPILDGERVLKWDPKTWSWCEA